MYNRVNIVSIESCAFPLVPRAVRVVIAGSSLGRREARALAPHRHLGRRVRTPHRTRPVLRARCARGAPRSGPHTSFPVQGHQLVEQAGCTQALLDLNRVEATQHRTEGPLACRTSPRGCAPADRRTPRDGPPTEAGSSPVPPAREDAQGVVHVRARISEDCFLWRQLVRSTRSFMLDRRACQQRPCATRLRARVIAPLPVYQLQRLRRHVRVARLGTPAPQQSLPHRSERCLVQRQRGDALLGYLCRRASRVVQVARRLPPSPLLARRWKALPARALERPPSSPRSRARAG